MQRVSEKSILVTRDRATRPATKSVISMGRGRRKRNDGWTWESMVPIGRAQ